MLPAIEILAIEERDPTVGLPVDWESEQQNESEQQKSIHEGPPTITSGQSELSAAEHNAPPMEGLQECKSPDGTRIRLMVD
jgi:hypothetical protein